MFFPDGVCRPLTSKSLLSMEFVSMLFTLFYFFPVFFIEGSPIHFVLVGLLYLGLLINLIFCALLSGRFKILSALLLVVFATLGAGFYLGTHTFYGFALFYMALHLRFAYAFLGLLFTLACIAVAAVVFDLLVVYFLVPALIPCLILYVSGVFERQRQSHNKRELLSREQLDSLAAVAERERIARDLHDVLGHTLSSVALKSQLAEKLINANSIDLAKKEISEVAHIASSALSDVREAISGYKSMSIEKRLLQLGDRLQEKGISVDIDCDFSLLNAKAESAVSLLLTEAVTNVLRHSSAARVSIRTRSDSDDFELTFCDNGDVSEIVPGNGIQGIRERVEDMGGKFELRVNNGLCLFIVLGEGSLR